MQLLTATLRLYLDSARDAGRAFARSAWALGVLVIVAPILTIATLLVGALPMIGGMLVALLMDACAGTYLACLQDALSMRRPMSFAGVRSNLGRYTWDIVSVQFPLWLVTFFLGMLQLPGPLALAFQLACFLFLNALPESIGRSRTRSIDALQEVASFMTREGPEWFVGQLPLFVGLGLWVGWGTAFDFGPQFGFILSGGMVFSSLTLGGAVVAQALGLVALTHLWMLFRGALYQRLQAGGRRQRAWQENFR